MTNNNLTYLACKTNNNSASNNGLYNYDCALLVVNDKKPLESVSSFNLEENIIYKVSQINDYLLWLNHQSTHSIERKNLSSNDIQPSSNFIVAKFWNIVDFIGRINVNTDKYDYDMDIDYSEPY